MEKSGIIVQSGTPQDLYNNPKDSYVANFFGETNKFRGVVQNKIKSCDALTFKLQKCKPGIHATCTNTTKYRKIPQNTAKYHEIPRNTAKYLRIPRNIVE